ncbi:MAG: carbon-nitrogen family hydrolase [Anaerolineae bacterium]
MKLNISLAQMESIHGQPESNLEKTCRLAMEAGRRGSDIVIFPELWLTSFELKEAGRLAIRPGDGFFARLAKLSRENGLYITGSMLLSVEGRYFNSAPLFSPAGECLGWYSKVHLFSLARERDYLTSGQDFPLFDTPWGRSAIAICYDLRFPELFRKYALAGAKIVFLPAGWPHPRLEHWRTLLAARAIENQMFIAACNHVGSFRDMRFFGHSTICDPWGDRAVEAGETEALLTVQIDLSKVEEVRNYIKVFSDRRPELY